jgi:hypothetical protein
MKHEIFIVARHFNGTDIPEQSLRDLEEVLRAKGFNEIKIQRIKARFVFEAIKQWWERLPP